MNPKTDEELVIHIKRGDVLSFEELVKRYQRRLFSFVVHIVHDRHTAEEVVEDTLFAVYRTIDQIDTSKKFASYLFTIAKNTAISRLRQLKKHVSLEAIEHMAANDASVYDNLILAEQRRSIRTAMQRLEEKYRTVIRLYYFDDLSYEEISRKLHLPINTIRTHLSRAKKSLREILHYEVN